MNGKIPPDEESAELSDWLLSGGDVDLYALGFQEVVPLTASNVLIASDAGANLAEWEANFYRRKQIGRTASHRAAGYGPYAAGQGTVPTQPGNNIVMTPFVEGTHTWVDTPVVSWYSDDDGRRQSREWHDGYGLAALGDREVRVTADYVALGPDNSEIGEWANSATSGFYIHTGPGPADG